MRSMNKFLASLIAPVATVASLAAWAADPWVSIPSTPTADGRMVITGAGFAPGAVVNVRLRSPGGTVVAQPNNASVAGKLRHEIVLGEVGGYAVEVYDGNGKLLGKGLFGYVR